MSLANEILGNPIKLENLELAQNDLPEAMVWQEANDFLNQIEGIWRIPTKEELNTLFTNKDKINGFADEFYWSSIEGNYGCWRQHFKDGRQFDTSKKVKCLIRAVRSI